MADFQKTDTSKSPLLRPVIERDYTKGIGYTQPQGPAPGGASGEAQEQPKPGAQEQGAAGEQNKKSDSTAPGDDFTRPFSFDEEVESPSDIGNDGEGPGVTMPAGSAKAFANFGGDAIQLYLPKATYGYAKIDMENVIVNVEKGNLTTNWIDVFEKINKATEEALKIPDEPIKMWKKACKECLEYNNIALANPNTAFIAATILLLVDQAIRVYTIKKANEQYMREAIQASNPELLKTPQYKKKEESKETTLNDNNNESAKAA